MRGFCLAVALSVPGSLLANWPQWRGPNSDGSAPNARDLPGIFLGSPDFGRILSAGQPRRMQFGLKLLF